MPPLKLRSSLPLPLPISHNLSRTFSIAASAADRPSTARPIAAAKGCDFQLILNGNVANTQYFPLCSLRGGMGVGGSTLAPGARLAPAAHVKASRIKPLFPSSSPTFSLIGGVHPNIKKRAALCLSSFSSAASSEWRRGGDSASGSGSEIPNMGHEHPYGVDYCQSGDASPRLSFKRSDKEKLEDEDEEKEKYARLLTLPTILTLARVASVPAFVCIFYVNSWWGSTITTSIFIAAAVTDWLDGYLARKMRQGTAFGAFLDPVADKLMVATTLVLLCSRPLEVPIFGDAPWLFPVPSIAIIGREITMSAVREWAASQQGKLSEAVAVNNLGKWKTATQMISLTILLACRDSSFGRPDGLVASGIVLLYVSAWLAVWSLIVYMKKIWKVLLK